MSTQSTIVHPQTRKAQTPDCMNTFQKSIGHQAEEAKTEWTVQSQYMYIHETNCMSHYISQECKGERSCIAAERNVLVSSPMWRSKCILDARTWRSDNSQHACEDADRLEKRAASLHFSPETSQAISSYDLRTTICSRACRMVNRRNRRFFPE